MKGPADLASAWVGRGAHWDFHCEGEGAVDYCHPGGTPRGWHWTAGRLIAVVSLVARTRRRAEQDS
jgi:hypothetical protein